MEETQAKYHHLIPQTYMSSWANEAGTLQIEFLNNPGVFKPRNKENIAGITDYHSIKAGMVICTKDDADKIFFPLTDYTVEIDGQIVTDTLELNQKYYDFDSWTIRRRDGSLVSKKGIKHEVLNAKNHAREAEIISHAGERGAVTIATNMAGRGTDIKLTEETKALGGLCVIGTERHESRRIDNQLRGRAGRQGDPGESQFFVSMEDDLMVRFGTDRIKTLLQTMGFQEDQAIRSKTFTNALSSAQAKVEGNNFDIRKQLLQYDDVMNNQREDIYERRNEILDNNSIHETVLDTFHSYIGYLIDTHFTDNHIEGEALKDLVDIINHDLLNKHISEDDIKTKNADETVEFIFQKVKSEYEEKLSVLPIEVSNEFEKAISLNVIDKYWTENINTLSHLREAVMMRGYGGQDPLRAYTMEGLELYENMLDRIDKDTTIFLKKAEIRQNIERKEVVKKQITNESDTSTFKQPKRNKEKVGRNDPCPCGSGRKYKQCCGK